MRLGLLQEELPRAPSSERSGEMQGVVQRLELRSAASPVQPVGDPNVRQGIATKLYERIAMKLLPMTACAMALSVSIAAAQTQSNPGAGNTATPPSTSAAPSDPVAPGGHWNVASAQCRELLGEFGRRPRSHRNVLLWLSRSQTKPQHHRYIPDRERPASCVRDVPRPSRYDYCGCFQRLFARRAISLPWRLATNLRERLSALWWPAHSRPALLHKQL